MTDETTKPAGRDDPSSGAPPAAEHRPTFMETLEVLKRASRGFWMVNWVNFGDGVAYFGILALMPLFFEKNLGFTANHSTFATSTFTGLVTLLMVLGAGALSDAVGSRRALSLSLAIILLGRILLVLSPHAPIGSLIGAVAWTSIIVMGFGEGIIQPALYAGVKEYTDKRTATMGYAFLYSIMNLGIVLGELASPLVRETYAREIEGTEVSQDPAAGISGAFWFFVGVTAVVLIVNLLLFTKKVEQRDKVKIEAEEEKDSPKGVIAKLRSLPILDPRFMFFIFILLPVRTLFAHQWLTMPYYVTRAFPTEIGSRWEWINGLNPLVIVIAVPLFAALTQHRRVVDMMIVGTTVSALATFMLVAEPNLTLLLTYVVVFSLGEAIWSSRFLEYIANMSPANRIGIYMGLAGLPWWLAKFTTGFYAGAMVDAFVPKEGPQDPGTMWGIYGLIALISPIGLIIARRWLLAKENEVG